MNIQDTGIRGYLKWLQQDQPGIYAAAAPQIAQKVPEAFSDREQSIAQGALMGLSDDTTSDNSWLLTDSGGGSGSASAGTTTTTDVASAANSGAVSSGITGAIGNIVSAISQVYLAKNQVNTLNQVNQIQLQRAAAGLPPLNTGSLQLGIPQAQVNLGLSSTTMTAGGVVLAVAAGLGLLFALSGRGKRSSARA